MHGAEQTLKRLYRVILFTGPPLNILSTRFHVNWPGISRSASANEMILNLYLGGGSSKKNHPVQSLKGSFCYVGQFVASGEGFGR